MPSITTKMLKVTTKNAFRRKCNLEDNVEIGNLCTIDRGVTDSTIIGCR